ncbi:hypothetical protein MSP7336_00859 [Mycobacterium shimoidei]|uniref:Uncharacterized protein n=1 Tax=Mycobacterium shimoidei TaxID=29313 RepID=A0A375YUN2_MYCSH|nr:hypothetical protein [Mycobacterium shimoidei]SRX92633.1 hypothetical protein MSP7336_00859 [Mycobacterium shimoidei]
MIGQGHQVFTDELARFAATSGDALCAVIVERLAAPLRVVVTGRAGVGRRTVARALGRCGVTTCAGPADMQVHVVVEVVKPEDRAAVAAARHPLLVVWNKADVTGEPHVIPGVPVEPMVALLAVAELDDTAWIALQALAADPCDVNSWENFVTADHAIPAQTRRRLLDVFDLVGIAQMVADIRRGAPKAVVQARLRQRSRVDAVVAKITALGAAVRYQRILEAVAEMEALGVSDRRAAEFLTRDATVVARMAAAMDAVEAAGLPVDRGDSPAAHLRRALRWQRHRSTGVHRGCGADIARGSLRLWARAGGVS